MEQKQSADYIAMCKRFSDPTVSNWIEDIQAIPVYVVAVPEENRTLAVFMASVVVVHECIWHFSSQSLAKLIDQMLMEKPELFPKECVSCEAAFKVYAKWYDRPVGGTARSYYHFLCARSRLRTCLPGDVAQWVTGAREAKAFEALYGPDEMAKKQYRDIRALLVRDSFSL